MKSKMQTSRKDVERNERKIYIPNASWLGFSRGSVSFGDFFIYSQDGQKRLARYHGCIRPNTGGNWQILAQVASDFMGETYERWVEPADVIETCPADRMRPEIVAIFEKTVNFFG